MTGEIPHLPMELISHILERCTSKATVANAARCSRQWYDIAMPVLYQYVEVNAAPSRAEQFYVKSIIAVFMSRPNIAARVRHFSLQPKGLTGLENKEGQGFDREMNTDTDLSNDSEQDRNLSLFREAIASVQCADEERAIWVAAVEHSDAILPALVQTLSNLVSLEVMLPSWITTAKLMMCFFGPGAACGAAFTRLKSFSWTYDHRERCMPLEYVPSGTIVSTAIFSMPSIERICLNRVLGSHENEVDERLAQFPYRTSTCTRLALRDCHLNGPDLLKLITIPRVLRTFVYDIGPRYCNVSLPTIRQGLAHHKQTLEELCLDYRHYYHDISWTHDIPDNPVLMAPLKDFPQLGHLRIALRLVLQANTMPDTRPTADWYLRLPDFLPRYIRQLHLTHCNEPRVNREIFHNALVNLLTKKRTHTPALHQIILEVDSSTVEKLAGRFDRILRLAKDVGTTLRLLNISSYSEEWAYGEGADKEVVWDEYFGFANFRPFYEVIHVQR